VYRIGLKSVLNVRFIVDHLSTSLFPVHQPIESGCLQNEVTGLTGLLSFCLKNSVWR